ncbi:MAG: hypothetical protein ACO327_04840 [Gemmatimonadaceae bacterium]
MEWLLVLSLGTAPFGRAADPAPRPEDRWFAVDKAKHLIVSAVLQSASHTVWRANGHDYRSASWNAAAVTMTVGVGKELWDRHRGGVVSWKDLGADAVGGAMGAVLVRQMAP